METATMGLIMATAMMAIDGAGMDWPALNAAAREQAKAPVRPGEPGVRPFWNANARAFIHPPAFDAPEVDGAREYRFTLTGDSNAEAQSRREAQGSTNLDQDGAASPRLCVEKPHTWLAPKPWLPIPGAIWDALAPGYYTLRIEALGADGSGSEGGPPAAPAFERRFWRAAVFQGPYPAATRGYREAASRVYAAVYNLPYVQAWLDADDPPEGYDLYCYPAKILASMIRALSRHAECAGKDKSRALAIACRMADWLIAHSQPEGAPLAHFPPTYWGDRRDVAVKFAGLNMLSYPAHAALAYFDLADALSKCDSSVQPHERAQGAALADRYRATALAIVETYVRLQSDDGTWPLLVREADGAPVRANRLLPNRYVLGMFDRAIEAAVGVGGAEGMAPRPLEEARDRAFAYMERGPLATWNWDGQFEDQDPLPPYSNLQKGVAIDIAVRLFALGRVAEAREIVDWCEDQFTVWSDPLHHLDWRHWKTPTALEQYEYYTPIDASMGDMVRGFSAAFAATGDPLYRAKSLAIADNLVRNQRPDGTIPTYFDSRGGSDWVNCMVYVATCLETAASMEDSAAASTAERGR